MNNVSIYVKNSSGDYTHVDLFDDENIVMNSSVQNVKDITKTYTDFTHQFKIPASPNNNKLFQHWDDKDIQGGYDGRTRSDAFIEINYTPFKTGNIQLDGVDMRNGKPHTYKITFFGLLVNLKDKFRDDTLNDLDLSDKVIPFDYNTVKRGLTEEISGSIIFPLISSEEQWYYDESSSAISASLGTKNIDYQSGTDKGIRWETLKPAVRVSTLIDKIESKYGITFSDDFTASGPLDNLYMWASREKGRLTVGGTNDEGTVIDWDAVSSVSGFIFLDLNTWDNAAWDYDTGGGYNRQEFSYNITITPESGYAGTEWAVDMRNELEDGNPLKWTSGIKTGTKTSTGTISVRDLYYRFVNKFYVRAESGFAFSSSITIYRTEWRNGTFYSSENHTFTSSTQTLSGDIDVSSYLPKLKITDFINGLIKMYNLVVIPETDTSIYMDTLDSWMYSGSFQDLTGRVEKDRYTIDRVDVPSFIEFKFEEPQTVIAEEFGETNPNYYGDLEYEAFDSGSQKKIYGEPLTVQLPFEQMVYDRLLFTAGTGTPTDIQYGAVIDDDYKPVLMEPHLFYGIQQQCSGSTFGLTDAGSSNTEMSSSFMPFHGNAPTSSTATTTWNSEINEWDYNTMENSLFTNYWSDYISDLFDITRRQYTVTANLSQGFMTNLADSKNYNKIIIDNERYIINSYNMNLSTGKTKFVLLNDVYVNDVDTGAPTAPSNLVASNITTSSFDLTWDASTDDVGVLGYTVNKNGVYYQEGGLTLSTSITGQTSGSISTWTMNAYDVAGNFSPTSSGIVVETVEQDETAPSNPTDLTASLLTSTEITLQWSASVDEPGGSGLAGYRVYRNGTLQEDDTDLIYSSSTETPGSTNFWNVTAYDNHGNESVGINFSKTQEDVATVVWPIDLKDSGTSISCVGSYTSPTTYYVDRNTSFPTNGDIIYVDSLGETTLNGGSKYWWYNSAYQIQINSVGLVTDEIFCF